MMSSEQIARLTRQAARRSAREHKVPLLIQHQDLETDNILTHHLRHIPFIGDRCPRGWKRVHAQNDLGIVHGTVPFYGDEAHAFIEVDSSGLGGEGELALTFSQFAGVVRKAGAGYGYALCEVGQFQVVVAVFKPNGKN